MAASALAAVRAYVSAATSAKRGTPPACTTAAAVAKNVLVGTTTSRPPAPSARSTISRALVPLLTATAKGIWWRAANAFSSSRVRGPSVSDPVRKDSSTSASTSARSSSENTIRAAGTVIGGASALIVLSETGRDSADSTDGRNVGHLGPQTRWMAYTL